MNKSMLNPPEREQYFVGTAVKKLAKPLLSLFEDSSEKAIKSKMNAVHNDVEKAVSERDTTKMKKSDIFRMVAKDQDVTVQDVKNIEEVFAYKAGGGGRENLLGEIGQTIKAKYKNPTELQKIAEDLGGGSTTKEARKSKFDAVAKTAGLGLLGSGASYFAGKLSASQEAKVKENKTSTVTDITSGTMDSAFSKASKNPTKYVFMKAGQPHFKYKGKAVPFSLATEEDDVVLDMTPRSKNSSGSLQDTEVALASAIAAGDNEVKQAMIQARRNAKARLKAENMVPSPEKVEMMAKQEVQEMMQRQMDEAAKRQERQPLLSGGQAELDVNNDGEISGADFAMLRDRKAEGSMMMPPEGMPVDTYSNIPEDEMDEALASQLPDDEMEEDYIKYVMDESLNDEEQMYLAGALQNDDRLSDILDKVIATASEFSGAGEVDGPGTGVSDSIPARLSDGEFVFTKKATDQLGADQLQTMMDDAERAYDGGVMMAEGGMMDEEDPGMSKTKEEIEKLMMGANRMPSLR